VCDLRLHHLQHIEAVDLADFSFESSHINLITSILLFSIPSTALIMSAVEFDKRNNALATNPNRFYYPIASDINITTRGSDWYWAVTGIMGAATIGFILWSTRVHRTRRIFHYITAAITLTAAIAYFTMASNLGYAAIGVEFHRSNPKVAGNYREIFYVRYIDWVITTPVSSTSSQ
jgi:bacteriorhodopsin